MLYQAFSIKGFRRVLSGKEFRMDKAVRNMNDLLPHLEAAANEIADRSIGFDHLQEGERRGKPIYSAPDIKTAIVLKKVNDNLKWVFLVKQADRTKLIQTIAVLLNEDTPYFIIKSDIRQFYESISRKRIFRKVQNNNLLSYESKWLLDKIFTSKPVTGAPGLPRGLAVSATLSEVYLRYFDQAVRCLPGVYYYGRFVDDFIIFCIQEPDKTKQRISDLLQRLSLTLNLDKTEIFHHTENNPSSPIQFDFLGYHFDKSPQKKQPTITIATKKLQKIKTRIVRSILSYTKDKNEDLLESRIRFLTSNYHLHTHSASTPLKAGIFFNYPLAKDCLDDLRLLDRFLRGQIFSRNNITSKKGVPLSAALKATLSKYSFYRGYTNRIEYNFPDIEIKKIRECWRYD